MSLRLVPLLLICAACSGSPSEPARRPNVLILSLDSVRTSELSLYGGQSPWAPDQVISPYIDALGREGVVFDDAVSTTSWTLPSHMALLTGLPDAVHGVTDNHKRLHGDVVTLAEWLGAAGYSTAGFFSGPNLHPVFGFSQGFDRYENKSSNDPALGVFTSTDPGAMITTHKDSHEDVTSPALVEGASDFLAEMAGTDQPFLCFVHWWDPHYDYMAPREYVERFTRPDFDPETSGVHGKWELDKNKRDWDPRAAADLLALYHSELAYTDSQVGKLLARLEALDLADDTLVVLLADHGEEFFDHGRWGHQRTLFDEVVSVPLVLRLPDQLPAGVRAGGQARIQDIYATVADLLDVPLPGYASDATQFGKSLRPLWEDPEHPGYDQALHLDVPYRNIDRRALRFRDEEGRRWKVTLYPSERRATIADLDTDPVERAVEEVGNYPLSRDPRVVRAIELVEALAAAREALPLTGEGGEAQLSPEIRAELERLGYF